jgi:hypothetical protein
MKKSILFILFLSLIVPAFAGEITADGAGTQTPSDGDWKVVLITVITPAIIAALKLAIPRLPGWTLPIIAPLLGAAQGIVLNYAGIVSSNAGLAALLGMAGVGLREVYDQAQKRLTVDKQ